MGKVSFSDLDAVLAHARGLAASGYSSTGNWSLGQTCRHLAGTMEMSRRGFPTANVSVWFRMFRGVALWWVLRSGIPKGVQAHPLLVFGPHVEDQGALDELAAQITLFHLHKGPTADNPLFGPMDKATWTRLHLRHAEHHLGFLIPATRDSDTLASR